MTETTAFNLLDEAWIPVRTHAGDVVEVSLTDVLMKARDYAALAETSPPNLVALYRLLLAVLHRALTTQYGRWRDADRARWFRDGLPEAPIRSYLEKWRERFWLFHPKEPFMQVAALATAAETREKFKPITQITLEKANGSTPVLFDHSQDDAPASISPAQACRNLLGFLQFTPGGLVKTIRTSDNGGPLANSAAVVPIGADFSETLLLGLHPFDDRLADDDLPNWERPQPTIDRLRAVPTVASGTNDRYTRLTRAVLLEPHVDANGNLLGVSRLRFAAGLALEDDPNAPDPMVCYRINKDGKAIRISFAAGRAIWRDLPSLLPDPSRSTDIPPAILGYAATLYEALGQWDAFIHVLTAGVASDQAKLLRWRMEHIEMPEVLLMQADAAEFLRHQIRFAEAFFDSCLRNLLIDMIAQTMPDADHKDTKARAKSILKASPAAASFFSAAERALPKLMQQAAACDFDPAERAWKAALAEAAEASWAATRKSLGDSAAVLRAEAKTRPRFDVLLKTLVPPDPTAAPLPKPEEVSA
ncbi:type I-E CRISPR-associated protein Cse1/CasA [Hydrogenophilus islandicus]